MNVRLPKEDAIKLVTTLLKRDVLNAGRTNEHLRRCADAALSQPNAMEALIVLHVELMIREPVAVSDSAAAAAPVSAKG